MRNYIMMNQTNNEKIKTVGISTIKPLGASRVVDISVKKNETFVTGNGIVVHNCSSTQPALRGFIEEFSNNCRFILTCNFKNRIIEPLHSRCSVIEFNTNKKSLAPLAKDFMKRMMTILQTEGIKYHEQTLAELIIRYAPDWRRVINECQRYSSSGEIPAAILVGMSDQSIAELANYLRAKDFKSMRSWVVNNSSLDSTVVFRKIYDNLYDFATPSTIPSAVLILADYSYKAAFVADKEINMVACMTELLANIEFK
jgi:DNA polymerase III delta prime subunit